MSETEKPKLYGIYSAQHEITRGSVYYMTPSGERIIVTCVDKDPDATNYLWPDKQRRGEVTTYAGVALQGKYRFEWRRPPFFSGEIGPIIGLGRKESVTHTCVRCGKICGQDEQIVCAACEVKK